MKYCTNCGIRIKDKAAKFCPNCAAPIIGQSSHHNKKKRLSKKSVLIGGTLVLSISVIVLAIFALIVPHNSTLKYCEKLLGTPYSELSNDANFNKEEYGSVSSFRSDCMEIFGIDGTINIHLTDEEQVDRLTWCNLYGTKLSDDEQKQLLDGMVSVYGDYNRDIYDETNLYIWETETFFVRLDFDSWTYEDSAYVYFFDKNSYDIEYVSN